MYLQKSFPLQIQIELTLCLNKSVYVHQSVLIPFYEKIYSSYTLFEEGIHLHIFPKKSDLHLISYLMQILPKKSDLHVVDAPIFSIAIFVDLIQGLAMDIFSHLYKIGEMFVKYCPFDNCNRPIVRATLGQIIDICSVTFIRLEKCL